MGLSGYRDTFVAASVPNKANYAFKSKQNQHLIAGITMDKFSHDAYGGKGSDTPHLLRDFGNNLTIALVAKSCEASGIFDFHLGTRQIKSFYRQKVKQNPLDGRA